jgi:hypothetical protein
MLLLPRSHFQHLLPLASTWWYQAGYANATGSVLRANGTGSHLRVPRPRHPFIFDGSLPRCAERGHSAGICRVAGSCRVRSDDVPQHGPRYGGHAARLVCCCDSTWCGRLARVFKRGVGCTGELGTDLALACTKMLVLRHSHPRTIRFLCIADESGIHLSCVHGVRQEPIGTQGNPRLSGTFSLRTCPPVTTTRVGFVTTLTHSFRTGLSLSISSHIVCGIVRSSASTASRRGRKAAGCVEARPAFKCILWDLFAARTVCIHCRCICGCSRCAATTRT